MENTLICQITNAPEKSPSIYENEALQITWQCLNNHAPSAYNIVITNQIILRSYA